MTYVYVGSRTTRERSARGEGISVFQLDPVNGNLTLKQVVRDLVNPSYLTLNRKGNRLYTVHGDGNEVSTFAVDLETGQLEFLERQDCRGKNPVHLALDPTEQFLIVANHLSGTLAVLPVQADGTLGPVCQEVSLEGTPGPHRKEQPFSKPHYVAFDPSGRFVLVPDKGLDRIFSFRFIEGRLQPASVPHVDAREGAGPRHMAFHPSAPLAFVVNELDSTVTTYRFDTETGELSPLQVLSTLPDTFCGNSRAAGITVDSSGRNLYASNRGHDSVAAFEIDVGTARLRFKDAQSTLGRTPRFFTLSPDAAFLFALNEDSDTICTFNLRSRGEASFIPSASVGCGSPVSMVFSTG
jgi:6-phosphogluconolactonase (cycloisomerase 2 family)